MSDVNKRSNAMLGSAVEVAIDGPNASSIAEAALAVVCELAVRLTGDRPVVKVLFGENSQSDVMWTYDKGGRVTWVRASEEVSGRFQE